MSVNEYIIYVILILISYYFYSNDLDFKNNYKNNYKNIENENIILKSRIEDLIKYQNDTSKMANVLDNELIKINEHLREQTHTDTNVPYNTNMPYNNPQELKLSTDILTNLFNNMNEDSNENTNEVEVELEVENEVQVENKYKTIISFEFPNKFNESNDFDSNIHLI